MLMPVQPEAEAGIVDGEVGEERNDGDEVDDGYRGKVGQGDWD